MELTARFGPDAVELTYDGLVSVERVDGWVHIHQVGSPVPVVWPGELFPDAQLDRMQRLIADRHS